VTTSRRTKNVGEWSEVYALAYLLAKGGGFAADGNQEVDPSIFYKILEALFRKQSDGFDLCYKIGKDNVIILIDNVVKGSVKRRDLDRLAKSLHGDLLIPQTGRAFSLATGDVILKSLLKENVSAPSTSYNDIYLSLEDIGTKSPTPFIGFSIKSHLSGKSTLLNATSATNFLFQIVAKGKKVSGPIPEFGSKLKSDMQELVRRGYTLKFIKVDHPTHQQNMNLVDSKLAEYLSRCLFETTQQPNNHFSRIVETVYPPNNSENKAVLLKLKQYLGYVMLGMSPTKPWSGQPNDFGGLIMVKPSGDVLFYYLYNMADFQDFLYKNLKFEYGSRERHKFGKPFIEGDKTFIKLNLQLRFV
jgi:hypothetical protein